MLLETIVRSKECSGVQPVVLTPLQAFSRTSTSRLMAFLRSTFRDFSLRWLKTLTAKVSPVDDTFALCIWANAVVAIGLFSRVYVISWDSHAGLGMLEGRDIVTRKASLLLEKEIPLGAKSQC
jgi:hypothetical protein